MFKFTVKIDHHVFCQLHLQQHHTTMVCDFHQNTCALFSFLEAAQGLSHTGKILAALYCQIKFHKEILQSKGPKELFQKTVKNKSYTELEMKKTARHLHIQLFHYSVFFFFLFSFILFFY
jgi:hypothetical protein